MSAKGRGRVRHNQLWIEEKRDCVDDGGLLAERTIGLMSTGRAVFLINKGVVRNEAMLVDRRMLELGLWHLPQ